MEYKKETENFSFGVGTDKIAGAGKVSEAVPLNEDKSGSGKPGLAGLIAQIAAGVGFVVLKLFLVGRKKKKGHKR